MIKKKYETKSGWSINNTSTLLTNKHYKRFYEERKKIQSKYDKRLFEWHATRPPRSLKEWYVSEGQEQWREYLKEISDLMFSSGSDWQEFTWSIISVQEKETMERKSRNTFKNVETYK